MKTQTQVLFLFLVAVDASHLQKTSSLFTPSGLNAFPVDFQHEWVHDFGIEADLDSSDSIPDSLRPPNFVKTFDFVNNDTSLENLARQAQEIILQDTSGAILFRNLNQIIQNVSDFGEFWSAMQWNPVEHVSCYNRKRQQDKSGVDLVDTDVPWMVLGPHNEHACNPTATGRIAFYGLQPAPVGGESLIRYNQDIAIPDFMTEFVHQHGGIQTTRVYSDQNHMPTGRHPTSMSWQERCDTDSKDACNDFFAQQGMERATAFDVNDTLTVTSVHPGWLDGSWFNHLDYGFPTKLADGTNFPREWQMQLKKQKWDETFAYKLQEGDWLVVDNTKTQHGRLPYEGDRRLVVTYTD